MVNIYEYVVLFDVLKLKGLGFVVFYGEELLLVNNVQWIGFSLEIGLDGVLYVLDWYDVDICGKEVVYKEMGWIFCLSFEEFLVEEWEGRYEDLVVFFDLFLVELQISFSDWYVRRVCIIL